jgi:hypothetical protein
MSYIRKWLCFVLAAWFAAFALSANAGGTGTNKAITLSDATGQPPTLGVTLTPGTYDIFLQLNNVGQSGNASSAELDFTSTPQLTVNSGTISGGKGAVAGTLMGGQTPGGFKGIQFTFTLPNKSSAVITLNVTVTVGSTCGAPQIVWQPYAWTGGTGSPSTSFSFPPTGTYTSNLQGAPLCALSFADKNGNPTQPADAFVGSVITTAPFNSTGPAVQVLATQNGQPVTTGVSVSIGDIGACSVSGSFKTDGTGTATLTSISSSAPGACQLTASATGFAGATSTAFNVDQPDGTLSCVNGTPHKGNLDPNAVPGPGVADWGLARGLNRDGTCGPDVPFTFSVDGNTNTASFIEDSLGQPTSIEYVIRWSPVAVDTDGWSAFQPCVQYGPAAHDPPLFQTDNNGVCFGDYVPVVACLANDVNGPGDLTQVMPPVPNAYPFNDPTKEPPGTYPQYQPSTVANPNYAKVCVSQQGWTSSINGQGVSLGVQYWHKFIDQTDTRIAGP